MCRPLMCVVIAIRKTLPKRESEGVLMSDYSSAVHLVVNCKGGKNDVMARGMRRIYKVLGVKRRCCF